MEFNTNPENTKMPLVLQFLTPCPFITEFIEDDRILDDSFYSEERSLNVTRNGEPLYCALFKTAPTTTYTPGKLIPGGYTSTGKLKQPRRTVAKTDKRAGK